MTDAAADLVLFQLWQNDMVVAEVEGPVERAWPEILHYAAIYSQDGPVSIKRADGARLPDRSE